MAMGYSLHTSSHQNNAAHQTAAQGGFGGQAFTFGGVNFGTKTRNIGAAAGMGSVAGTASAGGAASLLVPVAVGVLIIGGVLWVTRRKR